MSNNSVTKIWIILGVLIIALAGGIVIYTQNQNKGSLPVFTSPSAQTALPLGLSKVQKMTATYPKLVKTIIQQQIEGTLTAIDNNKWVIEQDGQTITLVQEGITEIQYYKLPPTATGSAKLSVPVAIKVKDLQIGNRISVYQTIDYQTGKTSITSIVVLGKN